MHCSGKSDGGHFAQGEGGAAQVVPVHSGHLAQGEGGAPQVVPVH